MAVNPAQRQRHFSCRGFTLIEVLVAMAILSLGMIAVFSGMSQSLNVTARLRDKTLASWIALDRITELQVTGEYPDAGNRSDEVEMARMQWAYEMKISSIPQMEMRRIDITVSFADSPDDILATVIGFIGPRKVNPTGAQGEQDTSGTKNNDSTSGDGFGSGWEPPRENLGESG
jgi:general secretion pathway protein I